MLRALLVGVALGVVSEIVANAAGFWLYRKTISPLINSLLMFGGVMGGVSLLQPTIGYGGVFVLGLAIGYAYE